MACNGGSGLLGARAPGCVGWKNGAASASACVRASHNRPRPSSQGAASSGDARQRALRVPRPWSTGNRNHAGRFRPPGPCVAPRSPSKLRDEVVGAHQVPSARLAAAVFPRPTVWRPGKRARNGSVREKTLSLGISTHLSGRGGSLRGRTGERWLRVGSSFLWPVVRGSQHRACFNSPREVSPASRRAFAFVCVQGICHEWSDVDQNAHGAGF